MLPYPIMLRLSCSLTHAEAAKCYLKVPLCPPIAPNVDSGLFGDEPKGLPWPTPLDRTLPLGIVLGADLDGSSISSMSKSSCSSSILARPTLVLLNARSSETRPFDPFETLRVIPTAAAACERAASSFVRCSSCVSMLMLACRGGLLTVGLRSPLVRDGGAFQLKPAFRRGERMCP